MARSILLLHRYLGIAVGALMVMWCLSGVVMMYVSYPALSESARLAHLQPITWHDCCKIAGAAGADFNAERIRIEMLDGRPVLFSGDEPRPLDLSTGTGPRGFLPTERPRLPKVTRRPIRGRSICSAWSTAISGLSPGISIQHVRCTTSSWATGRAPNCMFPVGADALCS